MRDKLRIAVDMDEVLADPIAKFLKLYNRDHGTPTDVELIPGKEFFEVMPEDIKEKWFDYINEPGFFRDLEPIAGSIETIQELQSRYDVYIVSAAMEFPNSLPDKIEWLKDFFPFVPWTNIIFCGKKIVDVDVMIDDRIKNFTDFKGRALLFSSPHNLLVTNYERVNNWQEVAEKLL